jgi:hypothetical protein
MALLGTSHSTVGRFVLEIGVGGAVHGMRRHQGLAAAGRHANADIGQVRQRRHRNISSPRRAVERDIRIAGRCGIGKVAFERVERLFLIVFQFDQRGSHLSFLPPGTAPV